MTGTDEYYDWECTTCGGCVCKATGARNPKTYRNIYGKYAYACRDGYDAEWVPVQTHIRDIQGVMKWNHSP